MELEESVIGCSCQILIAEELQAECSIPLHAAEDHELLAEGWMINSKVIWPAPIDRIT